MVDNNREEQYRRILRECHPLVTDKCDPDELVGPLSAQHLLTRSEVFTLQNRHLSPLQRLNELMEWLPRKGGNWFERFAIALATRREGVIPATDGHVIVLKSLWEKAEQANCPLPAHLQVWLQQPEHQDFSNHGDSLLDYRSDFSLATPGDSLSMDIRTTEPIQEENRPIQEQYHHGDDDGNMPSMMTLDKISSLLITALGDDWQRIHNYCQMPGVQFTVAVGKIKKQFNNHPHLQILMTLKQWTKAQNCSCQQLFDNISPLLLHSTHREELHRLLFNGYHSTSPVTIARPTEILDRQEIDVISGKMFGQISGVDIYRIALYYDISDDTMATLECQYINSPVSLLSNLFIHWSTHHHNPTRHQFAVILDNFGISPNSVM